MKRVGFFGEKRGLITIIVVISLLLIIIPTIVVLWTRGVPYLNNVLLVDMSSVQLEIIAADDFTFYDESNYMLSVDIMRGSDEIDLDYVYVVVKRGSVSYSYLVDALDSSSSRIYYFGEINERPDKISVFASIPLAEKNEELTGNYNLRNISVGFLNKNDIIDSGNWIYLLDRRVQTLNCEGDEGFLAEVGSRCFLGTNRIEGYCDSIGACMPGECLIDSNCYRGSECDIAVCSDDYVCRYSFIDGCEASEGKCGDFVINNGEDCDGYLFGDKTCGDGSTGGLKCTGDCEIDYVECSEGAVS